MIAHTKVLPSLSWSFEEGLVDYTDAIRTMEQTVRDIRANLASEMIWGLQHPPLYTAGTSAKETDIMNPFKLPVHLTGRGGQYTYHGPGQLVLYAMINLLQRGIDIRQYVSLLEDWVIRALKHFDIAAERRKERIGLWVVDPQTGLEEKVAAIGVRVTHWITWHGLAINIHPNLENFAGIIPCGLAEYGVTSFEKLGKNTTIRTVYDALKQENPFL